MAIEHITAFIGGLALLANIIGIFGWLALRNAVLTAKSEIETRLDLHERDIVEKLDKQTREFGETATALRAKIHQVEIWTRDSFVRRDDEVIVNVRALIEKIERRLGAIENAVMQGGKGK